jgi:hypothetical protein
MTRPRGKLSIKEVAGIFVLSLVTMCCCRPSVAATACLDDYAGATVEQLNACLTELRNAIASAQKRAEDADAELRNAIASAQKRAEDANAELRNAIASAQKRAEDASAQKQAGEQATNGLLAAGTWNVTRSGQTFGPLSVSWMEISPGQYIGLFSQPLPEIPVVVVGSNTENANAAISDVNFNSVRIRCRAYPQLDPIRCDFWYIVLGKQGR